MHSITKDYLTSIIFITTTAALNKHRELKHDKCYKHPFPGATDEEVIDFIISIPYFDTKLKDFIMGNLAEHTIIISQAWENEFIKNTRLWAENFEWLNDKDHFLNEANINSKKRQVVHLKLPY